MAIEKKEKVNKKRVRRKKTTQNTTKRTKSAPKKSEKPSFSIKSEIKGLLILLLASLLTLGLFGVDLGTIGTLLKTVFDYAFGIGAFVPVLALFYWGWNLIYYGEGFKVTLRGVLYSIIVVFGLAAVPLLYVDNKEALLHPQNLVTNSGFFGNSIANILVYAVGDVALLVDVTIVVIAVLILTGTSISKGMHKAKDKASQGATIVKEKATEQIADVKEQIEDWKEEVEDWKEEVLERKAYDQAKDPKYPVDMKALHEDSLEVEEVNNLVKSPRPEVNKSHDELLEEAIQTFDEFNSNENEVNAEPVVQNIASLANEDIDTTAEVIDENYSETEENMANDLTIEPVESEEVNNQNISQANMNTDDTELNETFVFADVDNTIDVPTVETVENVEVQQTENIPEFVTNDIVATKESNSQADDGTEIEDLEVNNHIKEVITNPIEKYEGAAEETTAVAVSTENGNRVRKIELPYKFPSLDILAEGKPQDGIDEEVEKKAELLESTLESFGIKARIINATKGPAVTRYELEPARGVKVSKIVNLTDDIALNLAATGIRMEAPIPGKAAIGIEVPNKKISAVNLREVLDCDEFLKATSGIPVGLGKDIAGKSVITDLSKMPHLLVAGSTGSGKSVCINTLISSILFRRKPDEVKMILIDPKMVELSNYNGVPHLMTPVVTDMKKAASVLRWAVKEMESRYKTFAETNVRDVKRYNELHPETAMPLIVIVIDELADLMMVSPADVEDSICRLAQMARAAGLHLVIATQRPSVDVITGTIKANVPSRISFAVSSQIDSRTILDMAGAEKLLGKGDMLFNPIGASKPVRIQGAFVSDDEVEKLVSFVKEQGQPKYDSNIMKVQEDSVKPASNEVVADELLEDAIGYVMDAGQASASMLQRKLRIGFTRAGRLIDAMEDMKIIGPNAGSKPRDLLMTHSEVRERYFSGNKEEQ